MFIRRESFKQFLTLYPTVSTIIALNTLFFLLTHLSFDFITKYMLGINLYIKEGELWRLVTPIFLHNSLTHFIFNSFSTLIFGPAIEQLLKPLRFGLFYLLCGVGANIITYLTKPLSYAHLGASGAIFGFLGFFIYLIIYRKYVLSRQDTQLIKVMTIIAFFMTFMQSNINVTAHLSGFMIGFLLTPILMKRRS